MMYRGRAVLALAIAAGFDSVREIYPILNSSDQRLVKITQTLPDESWTRLHSILAGK